ncbi:ABC transporter permease subunit [Paenibacillus sp. LMG 31461]|uniref:ABC transporter permease subunit n=1 Tax=Paenibacillus plantarum TaxID=2654975 RepID=A0ABX1X2L8_9BACL|nr:carbohydrate ABC transporter permease [Paenibacillus plantarum]NOU62507.1 ABC transporter permease subunit [Paenibacillus plantarum]
MESRQIHNAEIVQRFIVNGILILVSILCLIPLLLVLSASLSDETAISEYGYTLIPKVWSLFAYKYVLSEPTQIMQAYGVTALVTLLGTAISLLVSSLLAYTLSRQSFVLRKPLSFYVFFTMLFNGGIVPTYILVTQYLHLKNSIWALIIPYIVIPWFVLLLRSYFTQIPESLIESAKIEGAEELRIFFQIVIPLSLPAMATIGLFIILMYWNDWYLALMYVDTPKIYPLQYLLYSIMENINAISANPQTMGIALPGQTARMAIAVLATGPILFAFMFVQRFFVRGLTVGAVKG